MRAEKEKNLYGRKGGPYRSASNVADVFGIFIYACVFVVVSSTENDTNRKNRPPSHDGE